MISAANPRKNCSDILTFHPKYQANFAYEPDEAYDAFHDYISVYDEAEEIELMKKSSKKIR